MVQQPATSRKSIPKFVPQLVLTQLTEREIQEKINTLKEIWEKANDALAQAYIDFQQATKNVNFYIAELQARNERALRADEQHSRIPVRKQPKRPATTDHH